MSRITPIRDPELDAALAKVDMETYLDQEGVDYRHSYGTRGRQLNLRECPACHNEGFKTYINAETGLGNCFHGSCGMKFNAFKLIRLISGLSGHALDNHIKHMASMQGWVPRKRRPDMVRKALEFPPKTYALPIAGRNLPYLARRGIDVITAERFLLHYCHKGFWGYELEDGTRKFIYFGERVIIPILDLAGTLVSFQGRDTTGKQEPKYLFPPGFAVAGSHLYNGNTFEDQVHRHAIVGEGAFDVIAIDQALGGDARCRGMIALGTFGMHLSSGPGGQLEKFAQLRDRGLRTVTFMWDGEGKAIRMAAIAGLQLLGLGLHVTIAKLPLNKDPNEVEAEVVRKAIFESERLTRLSAIRISQEAMLMK